MSRTSFVIRLFLLVLLAGNLAPLSVSHEPLGDVEAVTEWRYESGTAVNAVDDDPELPLALAPRRLVAERLSGPAILPYVPQPFVREGTVIPATRAPPRAAV